MKIQLYNITDFARTSYALHAMIMQKKGEKEDRELLNGFFSHFTKNLMNGYKIIDYEKFFNRAKGEYKVQILVDYDIPVEPNTKEFNAIRDIVTYIQSFLY